MRVCSRCKVSKEVSEFGKSRTNRDRIASWCNQCKNDQVRKKRLENPVRYKEMDQARRRKNPAFYKAQQYRCNHSLRGRFNRLTRSARKRGLVAEVTFEQYVNLASSPCYYCGSPLSPVGYSLDRINNSLGYTFGNLRPCCRFCNTAKNDMPEQEFKKLIVVIHKNWASNKPVETVEVPQIEAVLSV